MESPASHLVSLAEKVDSFFVSFLAYILLARLQLK